MKNIVLVDAFNIIYRAFHGNQHGLKTSSGLPTNAIYTTLNMIKNLNKKLELHEGIAIFDGSSKNFRDVISVDYKANRSAMPADLKVQLEPIKEGLGVLGWNYLVANGYEADDLIGSIAVKEAVKGNNVFIVSGDKDFRQIVSNKIVVLDTMNDIIFNEAMVFEKMGINPINVIDYLALVGDASDNISGVAGIGKKTAIKLINQFGNIGEIIKNIDKLTGKTRDNLLIASTDGQIEKALSLVTLKLDMEMPEYNLKIKDVDINEFNDFSNKYEFKTWIKKVAP